MEKTLKKWVLIVALAWVMLMIAQVARAEDWDTKEKVLMGTFIAGQVINYGQTNKVLNDPSWREINPLLPADNTGELIAWKASTTLAVYLIADHLSHRNRKIVLGIANIVVFSFVAHDLHVGVGFKF